MEEFNNESRYLRAKNRVDSIRRFYVHFSIYVIICAAITTIKVYKGLESGETFDEAFFEFSTVGIWLVWGVGIAFHAFAVYGFHAILGKNWEERKIKEFMEEDENYKF